MKKATFVKALAVAVALSTSLTTAFADDEKGAKTSARDPFSISVELVYANALKRAERGGIDMVGVDLRACYDVDEHDKLSIGLLIMGGSESINHDDDLDATNFDFLAGYQFEYPLIDDKLSLALGARAGLAGVSYTVDYGRSEGWDHSDSDYDLCFAYAVEAGLVLYATERWAVQGGYAFYGDTAQIGGGDIKISDQQYHMVHVGVIYRF